MLECASIYTGEVDDANAACEELLTRLAGRLELRENTVGIVMCHPEFIVSGVAGAVSGAMPFPVVGCTTASQAVNEASGEMILTLFVMTADDVTFRVGVTEAGHDATVDLAGAAGGMSGQPKLALIIPPFTPGISGNDYMRSCEQAFPGTPVFGFMSSDDTATFSECDTLYLGEPSKTAMPFVLFYGNIHPRFAVSGISAESKLVRQTGVVTRAEGACVHEIDGVSAYQYLRTHAFTKNLRFDNFYLTPFMIEPRGEDDGVPVVRSIAGFTEAGGAIFHGDVEARATISPMRYQYGDIVASAAGCARKLNAMRDVRGVLAMPCVIRRMIMMGINPLAETEAFRDAISPDVPFMMGYAGGEFCPTSVKDGVPRNRFHNHTLIMLIV